MLTTTPDGVPVLEPKNLVRRRFVMSLGFVVIVGVILASVATRGTSDRIIGSGSTFALPLIQRMAVIYQDAKSGDSDWVTGSAGVDYEPVGSLSGIMRLKDPEVDFAIADYPLSPQAAEELGLVQFPIIIGSISPVYNLPGESEPLRFTAPLLAAIYGGKIALWSDPAIEAVNPGRRLPDTPIVLVHRADGSGSTLNWTAYLSQGSEDWKRAFGSATTIRWPAGVAARGSEAMGEAVKATPGAIGYLESGQAVRAGLAMGAVANSAHAFVVANSRSVEAGARAIGLLGSDPAAQHSAAASSPDAYPIVALSYAFLKRRNHSQADNTSAMRFIDFVYAEGGSEARKLGYLPLSGEAVQQIRHLWARELAAR